MRAFGPGYDVSLRASSVGRKRHPIKPDVRKLQVIRYVLDLCRSGIITRENTLSVIGDIAKE